MRFIIHSRTAGTFIDSSYGGDFFSAWPTSTFTRFARTFKSKGEASAFAERWLVDEDYHPGGFEFLPVQTDQEGATMSECVAAGAAPWEHHIARAMTDRNWASHTPRPLATFLTSASEGSAFVGAPSSGKSVSMLLHGQLQRDQL